MLPLIAKMEESIHKRSVDLATECADNSVIKLPASS